MAASKAESKDRLHARWRKAVDAFPKLQAPPRGAFRSEREATRACTVFNRAIDQLRGGNRDIALIALEKLSADHPLFSEAQFLCALCLADNRRFREAEDRIEKALLSQPDPDLREAMEACRLDVREARVRREAEETTRRRDEAALLPVRAKLARGGILHRAAGSDGRDVRMAGYREREEVMRRLREGGEGTIAPEDPRDRAGLRTVRLVSLVVAILAAVALLYFLVIRPHVAETARLRERLTWFEQQLETRPADETVGALRDAYHAAFLR